MFPTYFILLIHFSSFFRADRVPGGLGRPQEKRDPDFLFRLCALPRACGASQTSKTTTFLDVQVCRRNKKHFAYQPLIPEQRMHLYCPFNLYIYACTLNRYPAQGAGDNWPYNYIPEHQTRTQIKLQTKWTQMLSCLPAPWCIAADGIHLFLFAKRRQRRFAIFATMCEDKIAMAYQRLILRVRGTTACPKLLDVYNCVIVDCSI